MNPHVAWRLEVARPIAELYAAHPKMASVVIAGSVGSGWADRYSDVELHTFWREAPTDDERRALATQAGAAKHELWPYEDDEWSDELHVPVPGGTLQVGFSQFLVETLERWIEDAVMRFDTTLDHQIQIAAVQRSIPVSGHALIERWRERAATYPEGLRQAMVGAHLPFYGRWYGVDMLAARRDVLVLYEIAHEVCRQVMGVLHGLNRIYVANPHHKWLPQTAAEFTIAPADLAPRLQRVFQSPEEEGIATLQALCEETLDLVARELPTLDLSDYRRRLRNRRAVFDPVPAPASTPSPGS